MLRLSFESESSEGERKSSQCSTPTDNQSLNVKSIDDLWEEFEGLTSPWGIVSKFRKPILVNDSDDDMEQELDLDFKVGKLEKMLSDISFDRYRCISVPKVALIPADESLNTPIETLRGCLGSISPTPRQGRISSGVSNPSTSTNLVVGPFHLKHIPDFNECTDEVVLSWIVLCESYSGLIPTSSHQTSKDELRCTYMLECCIHAYADASVITNMIAKVAEMHNLRPRRQKDGQVLLGVSRSTLINQQNLLSSISSEDMTKYGGDGWGDWSYVDTQLVISKSTKNRVLLVRLLLAVEVDSNRPATKLVADCPLAASFVNTMRMELVNRGLIYSSLLSNPASSLSTPFPELDSQFRQQMEDTCRSELETSLSRFCRELEEYMRNEERMYISAAAILKTMFSRYKIPFPVHCINPGSPPTISSVIHFKGLTEADKTDLIQHPFQNEGERVLACVYVTWRRFVDQCDTQMSRVVDIMTRKVLEQLLEFKLYIHELLQMLRDENMSPIARRATKAFHQVMIKSSGGGIVDSDIESPIFYCTILIGGWPGTMYLTYWHLYFVSAVPGFPGTVITVALSDISNVEFTPRRWSRDSVEVQLRDGTSNEFTPIMIMACNLRDLLAAAVEVHRDRHQPNSIYSREPSPKS